MPLGTLSDLIDLYLGRTGAVELRKVKKGTGIPVYLR